jgi:hypothetical protein
MKPLPPELQDIPDDAAIVGDIDAFMDYCVSGQARRDWYACRARLRADQDVYLRAHREDWAHIVLRRGCCHSLARRMLSRTGIYVCALCAEASLNLPPEQNEGAVN